MTGSKAVKVDPAVQSEGSEAPPRSEAPPAPRPVVDPVNEAVLRVQEAERELRLARKAERDARAAAARLARVEASQHRLV